jgi:hypothetical protein
VGLLDGVGVKLLLPTGERYRDRLGRERERQRCQQVPLLIAYGVDPVSGERWLLDWELGEKQTRRAGSACWSGSKGGGCTRPPG